MTYLRILQGYYDTQLERKVVAGEVLKVSDERAQEIQMKGHALVVDQSENVDSVNKSVDKSSNNVPSNMDSTPKTPKASTKKSSKKNKGKKKPVKSEQAPVAAPVDEDKAEAETKSTKGIPSSMDSTPKD